MPAGQYFPQYGHRPATCSLGKQYPRDFWGLRYLSTGSVLLVLASWLFLGLAACGPSPERQAAMTVTSVTATTRA